MDNKELMGWMTMRTWHIFAFLIPFFALFAPLVIYVGSVNSDFDVPLMIMSVGSDTVGPCSSFDYFG